MMRLIVDGAGQVWPDVLQKGPGRGAYLCMSIPCLQKLTDKHLLAAWRGQDVAAKQGAMMIERMREALLALCRQYLGRLRSGLAVGRNAVLRHIRHEPPVKIILAEDAGDALRREISAAVDKQQADGHETTLLAFPSAALLGKAMGRDRVSVAALDHGPMAERLQLFCAWYGHLKESR